MVVDLDKKLDVLYSFLRSHTQSKVLVFASSCKQVSYNLLVSSLSVLSGLFPVSLSFRCRLSFISPASSLIPPRFISLLSPSLRSFSLSLSSAYSLPLSLPSLSSLRSFSISSFFSRHSLSLSSALLRSSFLLFVFLLNYSRLTKRVHSIISQCVHSVTVSHFGLAYFADHVSASKPAGPLFVRKLQADASRGALDAAFRQAETAQTCGHLQRFQQEASGCAVCHGHCRSRS